MRVLIECLDKRTNEWIDVDQHFDDDFLEALFWVAKWIREGQDVRITTESGAL